MLGAWKRSIKRLSIKNAVIFGIGLFILVNTRFLAGWTVSIVYVLSLFLILRTVKRGPKKKGRILHFLAPVFAFVILIAVLYFKPTGIMGEYIDDTRV